VRPITATAATAEADESRRKLDHLHGLSTAMGKRPLPPNAPDDPPVRDPHPDKIDPVKEPPGDPMEDRPLRDPQPPDRDKPRV
jgi:hypothetical protein